MGRISKIAEPLSLGLVLIIVEIWLLTQLPEWRPQLIIYMVITAFVFSFGAVRTEKAIFRVSFLKAFPKMLIAGSITLLVLIGIGLIFKGEGVSTVAGALSSVPISLILLHGFVVSFNEEIIFRGWMAERLKTRGMKMFAVMLVTSITFALFHWAMAGKSWLLIMPYVLIGIIFFKVKERYSPKTHMANIGVHWGFNLYVLAFIERII